MRVPRDCENLERNLRVVCKPCVSVKSPCFVDVRGGVCQAHCSPSARACAARVAGLFLRLIPPDAHEAGFFALYADFVRGITTSTLEEQETLECTTVLSLLIMLGLDSGSVPKEEVSREVIMRINRGIAASGL